MPQHPAQQRELESLPQRRPQRIAFTLIGVLLLLFILSLVLSPYYAVRQLQQQLGWIDSEQKIESSQLEQIIPAALWQNTVKTRIPTITGSGQRYLQQVWPLLQQQTNQAKFLQLQLQFYAQENIKTGYSDLPNQFRLQLGQTQQIDMILQRDGLWSWSVQSLCTREAQPLLDLSHCPSDSR